MRVNQPVSRAITRHWWNNDKYFSRIKALRGMAEKLRRELR
jgi:hypothetical protein